MEAEKPRSVVELKEGKTLPPDFIRDEDERPQVAHDQFSQEIPVISLTGVDANERVVIRRKIAEACESWGIFQVVDHGVDAQLVSEMARLSREFFALSPEEKLRFDRSGRKKGGFLVSSFLKGQAVLDWRELVTYFTYPIKSRDYTMWPDKPEGWIKVTEEYSEKLMGLACKILGLLSEAMGLKTEDLTKACGEMEQRVVVNYYPQCPQPNLTLGLNRHTDPGAITLVYQDLVGGLQVTRDGGQTWITVEPVHGAFVVNLGDFGHYISNGRFKNADHRAVVNSNCDRLSIATFQLPNSEAMVYPLALGEGDKPIIQEPITFIELEKRKLSMNLSQARRKKLAMKPQQYLQEMDMPMLEPKSMEELLA